MARVVDLFLQEMLLLPDVRLVEGDMFNERSLTIGGREFLHIHGNSTLHILLPKNVKVEELAKGRVQQHPYAPGSGMIAFYLKSETQLLEALRLAKISFEYVSSKVQKLKDTKSRQLTIQDSMLNAGDEH